MKLTRIVLVALCAVFIVHLSQAQENVLTKQEKKAGWKLLFDGQTTAGWRKYKSPVIGAAWKVVNGELHLDTDVKDGQHRGDIITDDEYENYELSLEWKISNCGNSGIIFNVVESSKYDYVWQTGPEMQVLDNECHSDARLEKHRTGDLYDLIRSSSEPMKPAGEWNRVKILSDKGKYEFWLNGTKVVEFTMHTPEWDALVRGSKFNSMPDFGKATKGHIALQDHGDKVWYRNIKIREIK